MNEKIQQTLKELEEGVLNVFSSEEYMKYLITMSKFHNYSVNNLIMIFTQMPSATLVAGFKAWQTNFKRTVKKGEKGIKILAPCSYKQEIEEPDTGEITTVNRTSFKVAYVFDVSQTEGEELPTFGSKELVDEVDKFRILFDAVKNTYQHDVVVEPIGTGAKGYFSLVDQKIVVNEGMSDSQTLKTLFHERAHSMLHYYTTDTPVEEKKSREAKEVEAESVAFVVSNYFGIDTSDYSFAYIAGWSSGKDIKELKASLQLIQKTAAEMINMIETYIKNGSDETKDEVLMDSFAS